MSTNKQQIIHIVSEVVVISGITIYFFNKTRNLSNHIQQLENKIEQQGQIIQNQEQLLLKLMNNINTINTNLNTLQKQVLVNTPSTKQQPQKVPKTKPDGKKKKDTQIPIPMPDILPPPNMIPSHFFNPPMREQVIIMEIPNQHHQNPNQMMFRENINRVEEIPYQHLQNINRVEEIHDDDLDKELEDELKELEELDNEKKIIEDDDIDEDDDEDDDE